MPSEITISPEMLMTMLAAVVSLLFAYFPKLKDWYSNLEGQTQSFVMVFLLVFLALGVYAAECGQLINVVNLSCTRSGIVQVLWYVVLAIMSNQSTYLIAVRPFKK